MNQIEVNILSYPEPVGESMLALARLTQRGHKIKEMSDLKELFAKSKNDARDPKNDKMIQNIAAMPHGTIKRFSPVTIGIVGASRRFLMQARTHQVGITYVSASLQYSDYSGKSQFVVPYELVEKDNYNREHSIKHYGYVNSFLSHCEIAMDEYKDMIHNGLDRDTAGYIAPHSLRNVLIIQANHQAWNNFIRLRGCNRNTAETQYVALRIWEELNKTTHGEYFIDGPDCFKAASGCQEGRLFCGNPLAGLNPTEIINAKWPALRSAL